MANISEMVGKTFQSVNADLVFENRTERYTFYHDQDCCEHVYIDDITGDLSDLENTPLLVAEERNGEFPPKAGTYPDDAYQWTFYEFRTIKGSVTVRWYGTSNGYYSTAVSLKKEVK